MCVSTRDKTFTLFSIPYNLVHDSSSSSSHILQPCFLHKKTNRFGRSGDFAVICSPTDQGYFEPDTSTLIRLKLASEYGYGINPSTIITDKVNILGTGAHPFWRWIEGSCRAPSGLGRIQGNFEKFLVDGRTGKPLRRYPRQYQPFDIAEDIDAIIKGKSLPPAGANWREEWRSSDKDAEKDVYRFQKGLNFYDQ
jgi:glutathione peroxidase-family protein